MALLYIVMAPCYCHHRIFIKRMKEINFFMNNFRFHLLKKLLNYKKVDQILKLYGNYETRLTADIYFEKIDAYINYRLN